MASWTSYYCCDTKVSRLEWNEIFIYYSLNLYSVCCATDSLSFVGISDADGIISYYLSGDLTFSNPNITHAQSRGVFTGEVLVVLNMTW